MGAGRPAALTSRSWRAGAPSRAPRCAARSRCSRKRATSAAGTAPARTSRTGPRWPTTSARNFGGVVADQRDRPRARIGGRDVGRGAGVRRRRGGAGGAPRALRSASCGACARRTGGAWADTIDWCRIEHVAPDELAAIGSMYAAFGRARARRGPRRGAPVAVGTPTARFARRLRRAARHAAAYDSTRWTRPSDWHPGARLARKHHLADAFTFTVLRRGPGEGRASERADW